MNESLTKKIDFAIVIRVKNANPNGDPLNGNRPRQNYDNCGEMTDVCLKHKIRDRLMEAGHKVLAQSNAKKTDDCKSLRERSEKVLDNVKETDKVKVACETWIDVRTFGQLFAFSKKKTAKVKTPKAKKPTLMECIAESPEDVNAENTDDINPTNGDAVSIGITGPVTISHAISIEPVNISSDQITKSFNGDTAKDDETGNKMSADRMGMKHRVDYGVYVAYGSMFPNLAERTGFSDADANIIKEILPKILENDASSARPSGSMEVLKVIWWTHNSKYGVKGSSKIFSTLHIDKENVTVDNVENVTTEIIDGF